MVKGAYTTLQLLRYPLVFGGCLLAYFTAFSYRKTYFGQDIEEARRKNEEINKKNSAFLAEMARRSKMRKEAEQHSKA